MFSGKSEQCFLNFYLHGVLSVWFAGWRAQKDWMNKGLCDFREVHIVQSAVKTPGCRFLCHVSTQKQAQCQLSSPFIRHMSSGSYKCSVHVTPISCMIDQRDWSCLCCLYWSLFYFFLLKGFFVFLLYLFFSMLICTYCVYFLSSLIFFFNLDLNEICWLNKA